MVTSISGAGADLDSGDADAEPVRRASSRGRLREYRSRETEEISAQPGGPAAPRGDDPAMERRGWKRRVPASDGAGRPQRRDLLDTVAAQPGEHVVGVGAQGRRGLVLALRAALDRDSGLPERSPDRVLDLHDHLAGQNLGLL